MQSQWQQFLLDQGAELDADGQLSLANSHEAIDQLQTRGVIASLDHLGCIRASGADVQDFLQGQLSNDIAQLQNKQVQISAYCNPKGRMLAQFLVVPDQSDFLLLLPRNILEPTLKRLRMFILRSQVSLDDVSEQQVCLGVAGADLSPAKDKLQFPDSDYALNQHDGLLVCKLPGPLERYLLVTSSAQASALWQDMATTLMPTDQHVWHWLDIQAGLPNILPQTVEEFVPQMVNLELINGVNFKKGCYPGQEIVARMHYLGKPKRRMHHFSLAQSTAPVPGTDVYVADGNGQSAGKIVLAETNASGCDCLAVIQNDKQNADLRLGSADGPKLVMASLPYSLESA
jgi:tRNA-modifying protein YgfZ